MVLLTPALRALKEAYPASHVTLWLRPRVADLMKAHPYIDACLVDTKTEDGGGQKSSFSMLQLVRQVREQAFELAVVLHPTSLRNALVPFLARVPVRVGTNVNWRGPFLTASCVDNTDVHEVHRYLRVVRLLGIDTSPIIGAPGPVDMGLQFWHTDADKQSVQQLLQAEGVSSRQPLIGINLGTTWKTKQWPIENFAVVIQQIVQLEPHIRIVLTGASAEREMAKALYRVVCQDSSQSVRKAYSPGTSRIIDLVGQTTILQLGALIERFAVYVTCDSGPMHIAAAVATPTVSLFGPTSPTRHSPFGNGHTVLEKPLACRPCYKRACRRQDSPYMCMTAIEPKEVLTALQTNR